MEVEGTMAAQVEPLSGLSGEDELLAAARSGAYRLFAEIVAYPDADFVEWVEGGGIVEALRSHLEAIAPALCGSDARWEALGRAGSEDELAIEYTRLFEAGVKGPPCPLYGGLYGGTRMKVMEEAVRFYNHFGLTLSGAPRELPDHLATQLEFIHYLAYREAETLQEGEDAGPYRRAQRDFLDRHLGKWIPQLCERLRKEKAAAFFLEALESLAELLAWDAERLRRQEPATR
jgi:DMSO reductase family type II enzyme chaperone